MLCDLIKTPDPTISGGFRQVPDASQKGLSSGSGRLKNEISVQALIRQQGSPIDLPEEGTSFGHIVFQDF